MNVFTLKKTKSWCNVKIQANKHFPPPPIQYHRVSWYLMHH